MEQLRIDPEFQAKIPPLMDTEYKQLEENILRDGRIYEPIVTWNGIIVDGHNRYKIALEHPEIPFETREMQFADKWEAFDWMYKNQLGRRNLTDEQRAYLTGKMYEARKHCHGAEKGGRGNQYADSGNSRKTAVTNSRDGTSLIIANELGIGKTAVKDNYKFAQGIDAIKELEPELADDILTAKKDVTKKKVMDIGSASDEDKKVMIEELKQDKPKPTRSTKPRPTKTREEREADEQLKENISKAVMQMTRGDPIEATIDDLISLIQDVADAAVSSLRSILNSQKKIVTGNKETITESIADIFSRAIEKVKENLQ